MILLKSHGLGNDYLVLHRGSALTADLVRALCDRHRGAGADGVLEPRRASEADYGLRIWNPDGSTAEKSGNGLRIFARYLVDHRKAPPAFTVEVDSGIVHCSVDDGGVTVEMGRATFVPEEIPCRQPLKSATTPVSGALLSLTAVGLGNPHCVAFLDQDLDKLPWRGWGSILEQHNLFPNRTNVQFARVLSRDTIEARIWERGAGETAASGSSACAIAAAAVRLGKADRAVQVVMPGGALSVTVGEDYALTLRGPVEEIGRITLSDAWLAARAAEPAE